MSAWPTNWRADAANYPEAPYRRAYRALVARHGAERANSIVAGTDEATNADLAAWRQLGSRSKAA